MTDLAAVSLGPPLPSVTSEVVFRHRSQLGSRERFFAVAVGAALTEVTNQLMAQVAGVEFFARFASGDILHAAWASRIEGMRMGWKAAGGAGDPPGLEEQAQLLEEMHTRQPEVEKAMVSSGRKMRDIGLMRLSWSYVNLRIKIEAAEDVCQELAGIPLRELLRTHAPVAWVHLQAMAEGPWATIAAELEAYAKQQGLTILAEEQERVRAWLRDIWGQTGC